MNIGFIGPGKVGCSLGAYLKSNGLNLLGFSGVHEDSTRYAASLTKSYFYAKIGDLIKDADILFLTVPDGTISSVWEDIKKHDIKGKIICHCSGAMTSKVFSGAKEAFAYAYSIHPLLAISGKDRAEDLKKAFFAIEGDDERIDDVINLIKTCGNRAQIIDESMKTGYHAAAVFSSNLVIGVMDVAAGILKKAGFNDDDARAAFYTLAIGNLEKYFDVGAKAALTGPVERGDDSTVKKHLLALDDDERQMYLDISKRVLAIAKEKNTNRDYTALENLLEGE